MDKKKIVVLDSNSLLNRAFYALPPMMNSKSQPTGAVYGFTMMLFKIIDEIKPDYIAATFDKAKITFRHEFYTEYKAGRKKMPDELAAQFEPVKDILRASGIGIFELQNYEADDIIGTISKKYESEDLEVIIYTGDKDALQLVSDYTKVVITKKGITDTDIYDKVALKEKYGFEPFGIVELKGLMGDASDNIPGVKGVGEKTALKLLGEYGTVEGVYENIDNITGKKLKENLIEYKDDAFLSKRLATINREVPMEFDIESVCCCRRDTKKLIELFNEYEFKSLINRISVDEDEEKIELPELKEYNGEAEVLEKIKSKKEFNFIMLTDNKTVEGIIIEKDYFVPVHKIKDFIDIFEDENIVKNTIWSKKVYNYLEAINHNFNNLSFDFEIASYLINPSEASYDAEDILKRYADVILNSDTDNRQKLSLMVNKMGSIKEKMMDKIRALGMEKLLYDIEMPLIQVLSEMEMNGFTINEEVLHEIGLKLSKEIDELTLQIYDMAGEEFNINSPKQLGVILFEKLNLPVIKKTKTGYSTDAEVLEQLASKHEIVDKMLSYRQLAKLKSTYIDGLINNIADDKKIHSSFNQTVTTTGRISSTEPNLQNIPIKMEQGRQIRKAFIPESEGYVILSADYSQIELRVLAHMSNDENLIDAFVNNQDIHRRTAAEVFELKMDEVTSLQRSRAKAVNFGIVYGLSDFGLAKDLKIMVSEAKKYIENYFERYVGVKKYLEGAVNNGKEMGYVSTLMNRMRYIPEINSSKRNIRMFGERLAMNTPIQGTAADIIKISMVNVYKRLKNEKLKSKIILQVHDELVLEVHKSELDYIKKLVKEEMEGALKLNVPLSIDINVGNNWYEAK